MPASRSQGAAKGAAPESGAKAGAPGVAPARRAKDGPRGAAPASRFKDAAQGAPARVEFELRGEHIALDALLKATGLAESGGAAKQAIISGTVRVDGAVELRRGCKLRAGQVVEADGTWIRIGAPGGHPKGGTAPGQAA
ncbi:hypothetical protein GCM10023089_39420 [Quisquiliibacterium transsilvanicum]|uniref:Ribosome-associated protein YbcJ (S4-like RNA binding protein) n=1 Tax=Quisquiliibacterium transsilvanicum TaxID=1549638 RepID=A0A7W8M904_9BURK|nr:ribosome-associated protein YbcJ (S4-like RNA binding protein) [Quisquiliibacterium transsilvanicum]